MKTFFIVVLGVFLFIAVILPFYLGPDDIRRCNGAGDTSKSICVKADAIIAVSGGDTVARTREAIDLYNAGWAPLLIFSGAAMDTSGPSNALAMKRQAEEAGVPAGAIVIEEFSRTTAENADNTKTFIEDRSIRNVILVTSAYHQRRASLEFGSRLGDSVYLRNHPVATDKQWQRLWWLTPSGWWLAGGEVVKIIAFYAVGSK